MKKEKVLKHNNYPVSMKKRLMVLGYLVLLVFSINLCSSLSNESVQASQAIQNAEGIVSEMQARDIPYTRANESFQEALQLYTAQIALERSSEKANYNLIFEYTDKISTIKNNAFKAEDELRIFLETYNETNKTTDLSSMNKDYKEIMNSFNEERFEDTIKLINQGYDTLSEIESSQTALKLFYSSTANTIKSIVLNNWILISSICGILIILILIFNTTFKKLRLRSQLKYLNLQKETLNSLIGNLQRDYFENKTISEMEFNIKIKKFGEMIRDIDRQIPLLKEEMMKIDKKEIIGLEKLSKKPLDVYMGSEEREARIDHTKPAKETKQPLNKLKATPKKETNKITKKAKPKKRKV